MGCMGSEKKGPRPRSPPCPSIATRAWRLRGPSQSNDWWLYVPKPRASGPGGRRAPCSRNVFPSSRTRRWSLPSLSLPEGLRPASRRVSVPPGRARGRDSQCEEPGRFSGGGGEQGLSKDAPQLDLTFSLTSPGPGAQEWFHTEEKGGLVEPQVSQSLCGGCPECCGPGSGHLPGEASCLAEANLGARGS